MRVQYPKLCIYDPYHLLLNVFTASKGSYVYNLFLAVSRNVMFLRIACHCNIYFENDMFFIYQSFKKALESCCYYQQAEFK